MPILPQGTEKMPGAYRHTIYIIFVQAYISSECPKVCRDFGREKQKRGQKYEIFPAKMYKNDENYAYCLCERKKSCPNAQKAQEGVTGFRLT